MGKVVNLRQARKTRDKAAHKQRADENAARFGQTKHHKTLEAIRTEKAERDLDGHKRDT